ncbi:cell wall hydrolase [Alkalihalobacillus sp. MEB130]|uniref:cell wall hydrolase n=1 Tax=Alkalihalobacillus sp. MEB130 TaxID=2976704 RepID=UPI0028DD9837|nr:cell wall hydrolase [Alkalihalobacillus sp. MEB130]MDT8860387.1 cell wall hydrolase [Alkalihalobacillus sp. MEB130]
MKKKMILLLPLILAFMTLLPKESKASELLLKKEDRGEAVVELQKKLIAMEYLHSNATGYYGELTEAAVRQMQHDFNLLADGVAGPQTLHQLNEVEKIARIVHGEARGESYKGQVAVAAVLKNRLKSPDFPSSVEGVIYQRNAFTAVMDGQYYLPPSSTSFKAVRDAWSGWDPSEGATYYYNPAIATSEWIFVNTTPKFSIGNHLFAD